MKRNNKSPLVSVCIPTYNGANYISKTIESVLTQSFIDLELIIIDDHSIDDTQNVVGIYDDSRVRYIKNSENLGPEGNWNRCLAEARGHYIKILPHDDVLLPDALDTQVKIMESDVNKSIALVFGQRYIISAEGKRLIKRKFSNKRTGLVPARFVIRKCLRSGSNLIGEPGNVLFRRATSEKVGKFDGSIPYVIDLDYWMRLLNFGDGYNLQIPISAFRISLDSWSVDIGKNQGKQFIQFIKRSRSIQKNILTNFDIFLGLIMARVNTLVRILIYKIVLKR